MMMTPAELRKISSDVREFKESAKRAEEQKQLEQRKQFAQQWYELAIADFPDNASIEARQGYSTVRVATLTDDMDEYKADAFNRLEDYFMGQGFSVTTRRYEASNEGEMHGGVHLIVGWENR